MARSVGQGGGVCVSSWVERAGRSLWPQGTDPGPGGVSQGGRLHLERRKSFVPVCTFPQSNGLLCVAGGEPPHHKKCESKADAA